MVASGGKTVLRSSVMVTPITPNAAGATHPADTVPPPPAKCTHLWSDPQQTEAQECLWCGKLRMQLPPRPPRIAGQTWRFSVEVETAGAPAFLTIFAGHMAQVLHDVTRMFPGAQVTRCTREGKLP